MSDPNPSAAGVVANRPANPPPVATALLTRQMQAVLDQLARFGARPIEQCTPEEARRQPTPADAVKAVITARGGRPTPQALAKVENRTFPGPAGEVPIRIYTPDGQGPFPLILYIHGGGWVIADFDTYDASPRAIANAVGAVVVSPHYRQGPEHKFPAAHEDTLAAYRWLLEHAGDVAADARRIAIVGESAGANMAANVAIAAREQGLPAPRHQLLVYPIADSDLDSPSYRQFEHAQPLNKAMVEWMLGHYLNSPAERADPRIALAKRLDLGGLPSATIITAEIDPLRSDGERLAEAFQIQGTPVELRNYEGVTHEFFGMEAVVDEARVAQRFACERLRTALGCPPPMTMPR